MSKVWNYFEISTTESNKAICKLCKLNLTRGPPNTPSKYSTSGLIKHLASKHQYIVSIYLASIYCIFYYTNKNNN